MPELRPALNQEELAALHDLRDSVLFSGRGRSGYDRYHPDDQSPDNHFMGFWQDGELLGTLRVNFLDDETAARNRPQDDRSRRTVHFGGGLSPRCHEFRHQCGSVLDLDTRKRTGTTQVKALGNRSFRCRNS
jgi:hypothetical protein